MPGIIIFKGNPLRAGVSAIDKLVVSPAIYLHFYGEEIPKLIDETRELMQTTPHAPTAAAARFIGFACKRAESPFGISVDSVPQNVISAIEILDSKEPGLYGDDALRSARNDLEAYSPGGAGVFVVSTEDFTWERYQ